MGSLARARRVPWPGMAERVESGVVAFDCGFRVGEAEARGWFGAVCASFTREFVGYGEELTTRLLVGNAVEEAWVVAALGVEAVERVARAAYRVALADALAEGEVEAVELAVRDATLLTGAWWDAGAVGDGVRAVSDALAPWAAEALLGVVLGEVVRREVARLGREHAGGDVVVHEVGRVPPPLVG